MEGLYLVAFTPGPMELVLVALAGLLLFGNRLPSILRNLGRSVHEFRSGIGTVEHEIEEAVK